MAEQAPKQTPSPAAKKTADKPEAPAKTRVRKDYAPLDFTSIKATPVTSRETLVKHRNTKGERGDEQAAVDKLVKQAHERWIEAGKPTAWLESNTGYLLQMPEKQVETFMYRVRKAAVYYDVAVRFGKTVVENGKADVLFIAKDKPVKGETDASGED